MNGCILKGNIYTMTGKGVRAKALGYIDGFIKAVGSFDQVTSIMPRGIEVVDYGNALIVPGLVDTHMHPIITGISMAGIDMSTVRTIGDALERIRGRVKAAPPGKWIIATRFQDKLIAEKRFPSLEELDNLTTDHPILVLHNDVHFLKLNTLGIELLFGKTIRTDENAGYYEESEALEVLARFQKDLPREIKTEYLRKLCSAASGWGLTELHVKEMWDNLKLLLAEEDTLSVRLKPMLFCSGPEDPGIEAVLENPELGRRAVLCLINDGTLDGHTAALLEPYTDRPELKGDTLFSDADLERFLRRAFNARVQASIHAVGDATIEQILRVTEGILPDFPGIDHRLRIEHFEMPAPGQIERAVRLGITAGVQPMFIPVCQGMDFNGYRPFVGERVYRANTFKSYLDAGMLIAGGSDSPVTPLDPFQGMAAAMNHPTAEEKLNFSEALSLYTVNAARLAFEEETAGTIEPGKRADFTIFDYSPERGEGTPEAKDVVAVYVGGKCVNGSH